MQSIGTCVTDQAKERKQEIQIESKEPCIIEEQLSIDDQVPMKKDSKENKKTSVAKESVEKAFVAQRTSIERSSPPSFKDEVIEIHSIFISK